jgi:uncharacterized protein YidB (DUF937 family)
MINTILKQLASETSGELMKKANIQEGALSEIFNITGEVASKEVANQFATNGVGSLMTLFSNKPNNAVANSIESNLVSGLINNLTQKLGLSQEQAKIATNIIVPTLLSMITKENEKTPATDPSPLQNIFEIGSNAKGAKNALGGLLGKFLKG